MAVFRRTVAIAASPEDVFAWHSRPGALERLLPPWSGIRVERRPPGAFADGSRVVLSIPVGPLRMPWVAIHSGTVPGRQFRDEQHEGPFSRWVHTHRMHPATVQGAPGCELEDEVEVLLPRGLSLLGLGERRVQRLLARTFAFRHERTAADVLRHKRYAGRPPLRIAVTGAGGLLGGRLVPFLRGGGHTVLRLVRHPGARQREAVHWNATTGEVDLARLGAIDAVVHLAGESIGAGRWSPARKDAIRASRVDATRALCESLARAAQPPRVFVGASAVGYYGDRTEPVREDDRPGTGFLAEVCQAWESAAEPLRRAGARVTHVRLGMVLAAEGGALPRMLMPFRFGLGGRLGSGRQAMPWIAAEDAIGAIHAALMDDAYADAVNAVAPQPMTNAEFTRTAR